MLKNNLDLFSKDDMDEFLAMQDAVEKLPEMEFRYFGIEGLQPISSHHISHAISHFFPRWKAQNGFYGRRDTKHGWLETCEDMSRYDLYRRSNKDIKIIDLSPILILNPQLIYGDWRSPHKKIYIPYRLPLVKRKSFKEQVEEVKEELAMILL